MSASSSSSARPKVNLRSTAVKRIMQEASELAKPDEDDFVAGPLESDIFEWHCTMRGVAGSEYQGGLYHLRILLPPSYPMSAPDIVLMTPNGRFELGKKICIDGLTSFHAGSWQPAWGVRTAITGLRSFWMQTGEALSAIGALDYSKEERQRLAGLSRDWACPTCGVKNAELLPDKVEEDDDDSGPPTMEVEGMDSRAHETVPVTQPPTPQLHTTPTEPSIPESPNSPQPLVPALNGLWVQYDISLNPPARLIRLLPNTSRLPGVIPLPPLPAPSSIAPANERWFILPTSDSFTVQRFLPELAPSNSVRVAEGIYPPYPGRHYYTLPSAITHEGRCVFVPADDLPPENALIIRQASDDERAATFDERYPPLGPYPGARGRVFTVSREGRVWAEYVSEGKPPEGALLVSDKQERSTPVWLDVLIGTFVLILAVALAQRTGWILAGY
ncbi:ubiquitin-conjugating enzyme/RWD-like protein [Naematelia encephala]|uniref:Ubiquitin-conjugating enzyme/RWD-like protein n=1 Tax=Naematelia encephala TaxID=71784 RepID=A0A1Y2BMZ3_9TREE|nr:ubiquitin-conjugating enzyme/RWD-like protein [Naematelia encephala]